METCQSGWMGRSWKPLGCQSPRGFESHRLLKRILESKKYYSWVLYDWANSAYATIVLAGFFPIIYAEYFASSIIDSERTLYLGVSNSVASIILILIAPIFGLLSDKFSSKKIFLIIFALLSISSTSLLSIISQDSYVIASIFFSISLLMQSDFTKFFCFDHFSLLCI